MMKSAIFLLMISASVLIGGCATRGDPCAGFRQINPSSKDKLSRGTDEQITAHNESGERLGCWKAPR